MTQRAGFPYFVLFVGVIIVATAAILIRFAQNNGVPSMVITSWRLLFAALALTPLVLRQRTAELHQLNRRDMAWAGGAGLFLAIHLATWIASLEFTSVASSVALVTTNPLWVALAIYFFFGERLARQTVAGLFLAFSGSLLITFSDTEVLRFDPTLPMYLKFEWQNLSSPGEQAGLALLGNSLALIGAVTVAAYFLVGRTLRRRLSNTLYVWLVYSTAALTMLLVTLANGYSLFNYSAPSFLWMLLLALGPQLLGHTAFNWALAHLSATFITLAILGEPLGSAILAYFIFGESFAPLQFGGFLFLLSGIGLGVAGEQK